MAPKSTPPGKIKGTLTIDGQVHDCWADSAEAIAGAQSYLDGLAADVAQAEAAALARQTVIDARNSEIAAKDAEISALRKKTADQLALIDRLALDRMRIIEDAQRIMPGIVTDGLSNAAIVAAVVKAKHGEASITDRSDDYIRARFDFLADAQAAHNPDPFAATVRDGIKTTGGPQNASETAYQKMIADMQNAHKSPDEQVH